MAGERPTKKPVVPLRYRIDPTAKKLDDLDALEKELERDRSKFDDDTYDELSDILQRQREALHSKRGSVPDETDDINPWYTPDIVEPVNRQWSLKKIMFWTFVVIVFVRLFVK